MLAQGGGRALPFAPASVGAGVAILAAAFEPMTGTAVEPARLAAFYLGTSAVLTAVGVVLAIVIASRVPVELRFPRRRAQPPLTEAT
jgi:glycerol uptake facilitator-like aquaporin